MRIAVLMSTYNGEMFLEEQIESILNQDCTYSIDLIVRDDCSSDKTVEILEKYRKLGKLNYSIGNNIGAAKGFIQLLIDNPGYDFYCFADQDDVWNENKIARGVSSIENVHKPAVYCSNCELVDINLNSIGRNTHRAVPTYNLLSILCLASCAQGCTSVFNKEMAGIIQNNPIPKVFIMHDSLLTCLCAMVDGVIIYDHVPSMKYRMHGKNVFGMVSAKQSVFKVIKDRTNEILKKRTVSMYDQTESLLNNYVKYIPEGNIKICNTVIHSRKSMIARLEIVLSKQLKHDTINKTVTKKLEILLGND